MEFLTREFFPCFHGMATPGNGFSGIIQGMDGAGEGGILPPQVGPPCRAAPALEFPAREGPGAAGVNPEEAPGYSEGWSSSGVRKGWEIGIVQPG